MGILELHSPNAKRSPNLPLCNKSVTLGIPRSRATSSAALSESIGVGPLLVIDYITAPNI